MARSHDRCDPHRRDLEFEHHSDLSLHAGEATMNSELPCSCYPFLAKQRGPLPASFLSQATAPASVKNMRPGRSAPLVLVGRHPPTGTPDYESAPSKNGPCEHRQPAFLSAGAFKLNGAATRPIRLPGSKVPRSSRRIQHSSPTPFSNGSPAQRYRRRAIVHDCLRRHTIKIERRFQNDFMKGLSSQRVARSGMRMPSV